MKINRTIHHGNSMLEHLVGISILFAFLLPHTSTLFLLVNPFLCILLVYFFKNRRRYESFVFIVLAPIIFSILLNFLNLSQKAVQSTLTIFMYFAFFPFVGKVHVKNTYLYVCLAFIILSQVVYLLDIPSLTAFFDSYYPISEEKINELEYVQNNITAEAVFDYRLGGMFHNANDCARYLSMLLAFFISENYSNKAKNSMQFVMIAFLAILFTGSRTGFVVGSLLVYFGFMKNNKTSRWFRYLIWGFAFLGIIYFFQKGNSLRSLDLEGGFEGSARLKWDTFIYYLNNESNILYLLFGHVDASLFKGMYGVAMNNFDSEYGSLIYRFGFIGFASILLFYWNIAKRIPKSQWFYFFILLWMISSTIVASFRAFFIFMLLASVVYSNNRIDIKQR